MNLYSKIRLIIYKLMFYIILIWFFLIISACKNSNEETSKIIQNPNIKGEQLSRTHCTRCHAFPEPKVMPKLYWKEVLPFMGFHLGKNPKGKMLDDFRNAVARERLSSSVLFPDEEMVTDEEWLAIQKYYDDNSPEHLPKESIPKFNSNLTLFKKEVLPWKIKGDGLTYLEYSQGFEVGFNNGKASYYIKLSDLGRVKEKHQLQFPLVDVIKNEQAELLLSMGRMYNIDEPTGSILVLANKPQRFIDKLQRPVDFLVEDFDNDGAMDILVAEFGKYLGGINIYTRKQTIKKTTVHPKSGATKFVLRDVNNDGLKDFYVLVAQEDESIYLFLNKGNLEFEKQQLLTFPSYYGTTHFELLDLDNDGDEDIVTSSGDSDDFVSALKPYHGIRIFENQGENNYKQVWFQKQEGAYGTACADYDNDGDIDIASIGYYASIQNKENEGFLYFENVSTTDKKWSFNSFSPLSGTNNCFMLVKAKDIDADGDIDIILGSNSSIFSGSKKEAVDDNWQQNGGAISILRNTTK